MTTLAATVVALFGLGAGGWVSLVSFALLRPRVDGDRRERSHEGRRILARPGRERPRRRPLGVGEGPGIGEKGRGHPRRRVEESDLIRQVAESLAAIEEGRDGAQADVPGCIASMKRLRNRGDTAAADDPGRQGPSPRIASRQDGDVAWPTPDYSGFTILRSSAYLDLSRWRPIPAGTTPATAGLVEPALFTRVVDLIRKKYVSRDNSRIRFPSSRRPRRSTSAAPVGVTPSANP